MAVVLHRPPADDGRQRVGSDGLPAWAEGYAAEARRRRLAAGDYGLMDGDGHIC